ncbi:MAG: hypothetical protein GY715_06475 [Planctomycetes bacterium]|nr:hypothetical protein [Planctomycetota bacterium]
MHVLTKIFIVLVSLLSVLLVPLVVVYAHNEDSFQKKYQAAISQANAARAAFESSKSSHAAVVVRKDAQIQELDGSARELQRQTDRQVTELRRLEGQLVEAQGVDTDMRAQLSTLATAVDASQQLLDVLIEDLGALRKSALTSERQKVELDEALRDALAKLDAADEARRALQEELHRLKDDHADAIGTIQTYVAQYGTLRDDQLAAGMMMSERPIEHDLDAKIIAVNRRADRIFADIDVGSRDGVKEGNVLTIGHGGQFIARLHVIEVDINRSTGIVELEDEFGRGKVMIGHHVYGRKR